MKSKPAQASVAPSVFAGRGIGLCQVIDLRMDVVIVKRSVGLDRASPGLGRFCSGVRMASIVVILRPAAIVALKQQNVPDDLVDLRRAIDRLVGQGLNHATRISNLPPMTGAVAKSPRSQFLAARAIGLGPFDQDHPIGRGLRGRWAKIAPRAAGNRVAAPTNSPAAD